MENTQKTIIVSIIVAIGFTASYFTISDITARSALEIDVDIQEYETVAHVLGSPNAPITIVEFGDYQCPFCGEWYKDVIPNIKQDYIESGQVRLLYVDYAFLGPDSHIATIASYCADDQGKFWEFHEVMFLNQQETNNGWASVENLQVFASDLGLDMNLFNTCLSSQTHQKQLEQSILIGKNNGVVQTPTFLIVNANGDYKKIEGMQPLSVFERVISEL